MLLLGISFILALNIIALSVEKIGLTITAIMQKVSFLAVVIYAVAFFVESLGVLRGLGVVLGILTVILMNWPPEDILHLKPDRKLIILLPTLTFLFSSFIDISFFHVIRKQIAQSNDFDFISYTFVTAAVFGAFIWVGKYTVNKRKNLLNTPNIIVGFPFLGHFKSGVI